jgi:RNA polymerase sigma-70 factor (ECF subfamily)
VEHDLDSLDDLPAALAADLDRAFERLVVTYQHRLYGFALRLAGSPGDAEEIAQDAFLRAYRALATYPAERVRALRPRAWLYQITLNVFRNRARAALPREVSLEGDDGAPALDIAADHRERPEVAAVAAERRRELAARLSALPRHFRVAVVLRHVEGLSYREIAGVLDQPTGTVKAHVHRGTLLLREALLREALLREPSEDVGPPPPALRAMPSPARGRGGRERSLR